MPAITLADLAREQTSLTYHRVMRHFNEMALADIDWDALREDARRFRSSRRGQAIIASKAVDAAIKRARGYLGYEYEPLACEALADVADPSYEWDWWAGEC